MVGVGGSAGWQRDGASRGREVGEAYSSVGRVEGHPRNEGSRNRLAGHGSLENRIWSLDFIL